MRRRNGCKAVLPLYFYCCYKQSGGHCAILQCIASKLMNALDELRFPMVSHASQLPHLIHHHLSCHVVAHLAALLHS